MITTGSPSFSATKTEVVDVVNGETCADLADFPLPNYNAVGANLDGTPVICGGYDFSTTYQTCYKLTISGWQQFTSMKNNRGEAAAVMFQKKFHVFGGWGDVSGSFITDILQVNLFQKHLFLHQVTHNMTKDCSLNYEFIA